jgi:hypothetical protein
VRPLMPFYTCIGLADTCVYLLERVWLGCVPSMVCAISALAFLRNWLSLRGGGARPGHDGSVSSHGITMSREGAQSSAASDDRYYDRTSKPVIVTVCIPMS